MSAFTLTELDARIFERASAPPETSYTASLVANGVGQCARKLGEESVEAIVAAMEGNTERLTAEAADVLYHLLVLLKVGGVTLDAVMEELRRRTGQSGLAEKAARQQT